MEDPFEAIRIDDGIPESAKRATLKEFIDENHKLLTTLAAFVALTAFSAAIDVPDVQLVLPALFLFGSILIMLELLADFPPLPHHWRLDLFELVLLASPILVGYYWLHRFPWVVGLALWLGLYIFFVGLTGLVHWLLGRFFDRPLRWLRLAGTTNPFIAAATTWCKSRRWSMVVGPDRREKSGNLGHQPLS